MTPKRIIPVLWLCALLLLGGCVDLSQIITINPPTTLDRLRADLSAQHVDVTDLGPIALPLFPAEGTMWQIAGERVQVYEFNDVAGAHAALMTVSDDGLRINGQLFEWNGTPHFFHSGRVILLYVGETYALFVTLESILGFQFAGGAIYDDI